MVFSAFGYLVDLFEKIPQIRWLFDSQKKTDQIVVQKAFNMTIIITFVKSDTLRMPLSLLMIYFAERARFHALISRAQRCLCCWNILQLQS